jgi:plastocyanin
MIENRKIRRLLIPLAGITVTLLVLSMSQTSSAFAQAATATLIIKKQAIGGNDEFPIEIFPAVVGDPSTATLFTLTTSNGNGSQTFAINAGTTYDIQEELIAMSPSGQWVQTSASCDNGNDPSTLTASAGQTVTCTFVNTNATATLIINKQAIGGNDNFYFELTPGAGYSGESATLFAIQTVNGSGSQTFPLKGGVTYNLQDQVFLVSPSGSWVQTNATCNNGQDPSALTPKYGEVITCDFVNTNATATLIINKHAIGGNADFDFEVVPAVGYTGDSATLFKLQTVNGFGTKTFPLKGGVTYNVRDEPFLVSPAGTWVMTNSTCSNGQDPSALIPQYGQTITCDFYNTNATATLIINKQSIGGDANFYFELTPGAGFTGETATLFAIQTTNGSGTTTLPLKGNVTYNLQDQAFLVSPSGEWVVESASCDNGQNPSNLNPQYGDTITCTFVNSRVGNLVIVKNATGADGTFNFTGTGTGIGSFFSITTSGGLGNQSFLGIERGNKTITESTPLPSGWAFLGISCSDPDNGTSINGMTIHVDLDAGENVTCTVHNEELINVGKSFVNTNVNFGKCPPALGTPLATDSSGDYLASAVFKKGTSIVTGTNPGQIYEVASIQGVSSNVNSINITDTLPVDWKVSPTNIPGGIVVLYVPAKGSTCAIDITKSALFSITQAVIPTAGQPHASTRAQVILEIPNVATLAGKPLGPGDKILVYIKMQYGLKGLSVNTGAYPVIDTSTVQVDAFKQVNFTGVHALGYSSATLKVMKK